MKPVFKDGVWPVVLTPFREDGGLDMTAYRALLEYYIGNGVAGLFAVCMSSELYELTPEERLTLAREAVAVSAGRVPVVASAFLGNSEAEKMQSVFDMAATGVDAVVIPACQLVPETADEAGFRRAFEPLLGRTAGIRFGLYECPHPYHRLISPALLGELARLAGERLAFLKDTCCDAAVIAAKLAACTGTPLKLYNAHLTTCLESLQLGAAGYSGTSANFYPGLLAEQAACFRSDTARARELQQFFNLVQRHVEFKYPRSAKLFLRECGVPLTDFCRVACDELDRDQMIQLRAFHTGVQAFARNSQPQLTGETAI